MSKKKKKENKRGRKDDMNDYIGLTSWG